MCWRSLPCWRTKLYQNFTHLTQTFTSDESSFVVMLESNPGAIKTVGTSRSLLTERTEKDGPAYKVKQANLNKICFCQHGQI